MIWCVRELVRLLLVELAARVLVLLGADERDYPHP